MTAKIIEGKAIAAVLREEIRQQVAQLPSKPGLAVVLVGEDPASQVYVRNKIKCTHDAGMQSIEHRLPVTTTEEQLLEIIHTLNTDTKVHGILVQLPLPAHINAKHVIQAINPHKDVDGFHVVSAGNLMTGQQSFVPCTPMGCMMLIKQYIPDLAGKTAVVVGRSNIVGKPMAHLLLQADCTVTIAHSRTKNIATICKQADILVAAAGKPHIIDGTYIKPGAVVIDVGINRLDNGKLAGDVKFEQAVKIAGALTPVPGGVGPMTIACLLKNTLEAYHTYG